MVLFMIGVLVAVAADMPPIGTESERRLSVHMLQHLLIGDLAAFLIAVALTGPLLRPVLTLPGLRQATEAGAMPAKAADPDGQVHPQVIEVLAELGHDLSDRRPQWLMTELAPAADAVVTMGCGDACPYIPGTRYIDWELEDPRGRRVSEAGATRDDIFRRVRQLVAELDAAALRDR